MLRTILGVIVGYVAYSIALFGLFSVLYLVLGAGGSFQAGNYDLTMAWLIPSLVVFFVAGVIAVMVCLLIAENANAAFYMACIILILGLIMAFSQIAQDPGVVARNVAEDVSLFDAMGKAHGPTWSFFANAFAGALGAFVGGRFSKAST